MLSELRLREILHYDRETGIWTWLHRSDRNKQWNGRFVGKRAGCIDLDTGYWRIRIDDILYYAHRLAFLYVLGSWPEDEADHKNLNRADCSWDNLRPATRGENNTNHPTRSDNTSGFKGVSLEKRTGKWTSEYRLNGNRYRRSGFATAAEAHAAYVEDSQKYGGEFARVA